MKQFFLALAILPITVGAAPQRIPPPVERVEESKSYFLLPAIGEAAKAEVGESLYREGIRTVVKSFRATLKADAESKMDRGYVLSVKAGAEGKMKMRGTDKIPMLCFMTKGTGILGVFGDSNVEGCLVDTDRKQTFDSSTFPGYDRLFALSSPVPYDIKVEEAAFDSNDDFYVDVLYQGMSKGEVKISYREYSNGIARPAFNQDVAYGLDADGTGIIGFKGMRIKVLNATGHDIQYVVEQPMPSLTKYRALSSKTPPG